MKKLAAIAVIFACFSIGYYYTIYLPKIHNFEMQEKCAKLAKEFFNNEGYAAFGGSYECHYNKKLNKCFILVTTVVYPDKASIEHQKLIDVLSSKVYGYYEEATNPTTSFYFMDDKKCSPKEWHRRVKQYMKE